MKFKPAKLTFFLFLIFSSLVSKSAPLDSIGVTKINNKLHIKYLVSPGETIYGISTKFGIAVSDLMEINPELENGLKVGQVINIPYNPEAIKSAKKYDDNTIVHKVQPGETFYSLSKKYNTSVDELMKLNNIQLKAGQEIVVGYKNQSAENKTPVVSNSGNTTNNTIASNTKTSTPSNQEEVKEPAEKIEVKQTSLQVKKDENPVASIKKEPIVADAAPVNSSVATTTTKASTSTATSPTNTKVTTSTTPATAAPSNDGIYPYDPDRKQVLIIPFDPYLYFSDADDEIAARSNIPRTKVRQIFRKRLNALLEAPGYENIHLLGGKAKDSLSDMNKIYSMVTYNYQQVVQSPYNKEPEANPVEMKKVENKTWLERQKEKLTSMDGSGTTANKYDIPADYGSYFGVVIKNQDFFTYFNNKYSVDYYIFVSQFEVKTNYEHCLDRAAQNYDRTFTTHFSIFDSNGKQIAGNKFKTHYNSNSNYIYTIVADNVEKIAQRILADLPSPGQQ